MSRSKAIAVLFYLGAVVIGAAIGIGADRLLVRDSMDKARDPRTMRERFYTDMRFTPAQRSAWDSIQTSARRGDSALMAPLQPQRDSIWKSWSATSRALLTPEQVKLYDERQVRRPRPGPGPGGPGPGGRR